jgi:hypothetical protein
MWGRLERKRRRRTGRGEALKQALSALESVRGRYGRSRTRRGGGRAYGDIVGLGVGVLAMVLTILLLLWLVRRLTSENALPSTEAPEAGVEEAPPEETP